MAAVEVVSATSAFQTEKVEEPPVKTYEKESSTTETASPAAAAEPTPEELVKETENVAAEPAGNPAPEEADALAVEVKAKVVVDDNQEDPAGGENAKVAPEPAAVEEELTKEVEPETKVNAEEAEHEPADTKASSEEVEPATVEVEEERAEDEAEAEKSDE